MIPCTTTLCLVLVALHGVSSQQRRARQYDDSERYGGMPYSFAYTVQDAESYNNFGHKEDSSVKRTEGEYFVNLPDGRTQVVTYYVEADSGFVANVKYLNDKDPAYKATAPAPAYPQSNPSYNRYSPSRNSFVGRDTEPIYTSGRLEPSGAILTEQISGSRAPSRTYSVGPSQKAGNQVQTPVQIVTAAPVRRVNLQQSSVAKAPSRAYSQNAYQSSGVKPNPRMEYKLKQPLYVNRKPKFESAAVPSAQDVNYPSSLILSRQYLLANTKSSDASYSNGALNTAQNTKIASVSQPPLRRPSEAEPLDLSVKEALIKYSEKKADTLFRDTVDERYNDLVYADPAFRAAKQYFVNDGEFGQKLINPKPGFKPARQYVLNALAPVSNSLLVDEPAPVLYSAQTLTRTSPTYTKSSVASFSIPESTYKGNTLARQYNALAPVSNSLSVEEPAPVLYSTQTLTRTSPTYAKSSVSSLNIPESSYKENTLTRQYKVNKDMTESNSYVTQSYPQNGKPYLSSQSNSEPTLSRQYFANREPSLRPTPSASKQFASQQIYAQDQNTQAYDRLIKGLAELKQSYAPETAQEYARELARQYLVNIPDERQSLYYSPKSDVLSQQLLYRKGLASRDSAPEYRSEPTSFSVEEPRGAASQRYVEGLKSYNVNYVAQKTEDNASPRSDTPDHPSTSLSYVNQGTADTPTHKTLASSKYFEASGRIRSRARSPVSQISARTGEVNQNTGSPSLVRTGPRNAEAVIAKQGEEAITQTTGKPTATAKRASKGVVLHAYVDSNNKIVIASSKGAKSESSRNIKVQTT